MSLPALRSSLADERSARPRVGSAAVLLVVVSVTTAMLVLLAAWVAGGRAAAQPASVASVLPAQDATPPSTSAPAGAAEPVVQTDGTAQLPGADDPMDVQALPVASLDQLKPQGWTVGHLVDLGFGFAPVHLETGIVDGVRTVELQLSDDGEFISVAETRPEADTAELAPLAQKLEPLLDETLIAHHRMELDFGDVGDVYISEQDDRWTAAVESAGAQYVITSNLSESAAKPITDWVMATDRSRVQMPPAPPEGAERLERGFEELLRWID